MTKSKIIIMGFLLLSTVLLQAENSASAKPVAIGSRLELFVDRLLIDKLNGAELRLHRPIKQQMAKSPFSSRFAAYHTVIKDGEIYRGYIRDRKPGYSGPFGTGFPGEMYRYAESKDGHEWVFPKNNIILTEPPFVHNFSPFLDMRPGVSAKERFKALAGVEKIINKRLVSAFKGPLKEIHRKWGYPEGYNGGLYSFSSSDGIHWKRTSKKPVISFSKGKAFDSQNVSFWSEAEQRYICYFRTWVDPNTGKFGLRTISRTTSKDFVNWTTSVPMKPNQPGEHLYTSQTHPYFRAPHIYIALPTRFIPDRGSSTDILFMTSRAGSTSYDRLFKEAFIRPGLNKARWGNRSNYAALNVVPTGATEMSIYHKSGHRYTLRTDGFVSVNTGAQKGELITKPITFKGNLLILNYSTSAAGSLRIEIQTPDGKPVSGFRLDDCQPMVGDTIAEAVRWKNNPNLQKLAGKPVRLRFVMSECDLYSFRFKTD